jgi:hypothetical protein
MEGKTEGVGIQVIANGIVQAVHYYILATQIDKKCERIDALVEASELLGRIRALIDEEIKEAKNGPKEDSNIPKEGNEN